MERQLFLHARDRLLKKFIIVTGLQLHKIHLPTRFEQQLIDIALQPHVISLEEQKINLTKVGCPQDAPPHNCPHPPG